MNHSHIFKKAIQQAVDSTREKIAQDRQRVSSSVQVALAYISENLLSPDLSIERLIRAGKLPRTAHRRFRSELAGSPKQYLIRCRMETAGWLLRNTEMGIWPIACSLGYSRSRNFSRDFRHWSGKTPTSYRKEAGSANKAAVCGKDFSLILWWNAIVRTPDPERIQWLVAWLEEMLPPSATNSFHIRSGPNAKALAERVWSALRRQPPKVQRYLLRHSIRCDTPTLFNLLGEKSLEEGREDRQRGIEVASLAIESVEANVAAFSNATADFLALGWARLANARRLAHDIMGAKRDFERSEEAWGTQQRNRDQHIEGEILALKATMLTVERRFAEAKELLDRAITNCRDSGNNEVLAKALIQRAKYYDLERAHGEAVVDLSEALDIVEVLGVDYLMLVGYNNLAVSYTWAGDYEKAMKLLPKARSLCEKLANRQINYQLQWIEGLAKEGLGEIGSAEVLLHEARHGFTELNEPDFKAAIALDLAEIYWKQGHLTKVADLAAEAIVFFEIYKRHPDAMASLKLLSEAIDANELTAETLQKARACRNAIHRDPFPEHFIQARANTKEQADMPGG